MRRIGILTRDCAGINACIRAVVRAASFYDIEVMGIFRGYEGLIKGDAKILNRRSVSGIINSGGTILKTARSQRFLTPEGHSAVNVALEALDKIRDTATSLERIFVVEVMGRECGYIALQVALGGGCEDVLLPEKEFDLKKMCREITEGNSKGKVSWIIIVAEGRAKAQNIADKITDITGLETRIVVLGYIQRGGSPTAVDRIMAARLGNFAVELIKNGHRDECVGLKDDKLITVPLEVATKPKHIQVEDFYRLIKILT